MTVKNFWRQLKHDHLHHVLHPQLDHLVWILIHKVTPAYIVHTEILNDEYRAGQSKSLTTYQKYFKASWKKLLKTDTSNKKYSTCVRDWTCTCGQQKYNQHHIFKHLVQAVGMPSINFWSEVYRRRTLPIYRHHELVEKSSKPSESQPITGKRKHVNYLEVDGSITDGDDHVWLGDPMVIGGNGQWKYLLSLSNLVQVLGKQTSDEHCTKIQRKSKDSPPKTNLQLATPQESAEDTVSMSSLSKAPTDLMALSGLVASSSTVPINFATDNIVEMRSSSPIAYGSDDESEVCLSTYRHIFCA